VLSRDLGPRLASGLAMAALALTMLWLGAVPFALLIAAIAIAMSWEWGRVVRGGEADGVFFVHAAAVAIAMALAILGKISLAWLIVFLGGLAIAVLRPGETSRLSALGVLYTGLPAVTLTWLRADDVLGFHATLLLVLMVVATDTGAYFAGRLIGGRKLWPSVSPNKTWSGLIGGVACAAIVGAVFAVIVPGAASWRLALSGVVLGLVAQAGDLAESALKRGRGVKDASSLIPGHGGFMDRMDGLVAAAIAVGLLGLVVNRFHPAQAMLLGH
jgi:phosphatidate cytidylyltransferase